MSELTPQWRIVEALMGIAPTAILTALPRRWPTDGRCVIATRVGIEALRYFGIEAKPLVSAAMAGNAAWARWYHEGRPMPWPDEVWNVGVGIDAEYVENDHRRPTGFNAHLVVLAELDEGPVVIDLDSGQFARPDRSILPLDATVGWWRDDTIAVVELAEEGVLIYKRHLDPPPFKQAPDWKGGKSIAGPVIRLMREQLAGTAVPESLLQSE